MRQGAQKRKRDYTMQAGVEHMGSMGQGGASEAKMQSQMHDGQYICLHRKLKIYHSNGGV